MKKTILVTLALACVIILGGGATACAQDSGALLDALVRKKVLTAQEAEDVRADLIRENASTNAGKLQLSNSITSLKIYGDIRLRYQYDNSQPQIETAPTLSNLETETVFVNGRPTTAYVKGSTKVLNPATGKYVYGQLKQGTGALGLNQNGTQSDRERIRLRLNADFELSGGFFGGVQLQTTQASDSANQTMGDSATTAAGFGNYNIYISRAFVGWNATDWLTLVGGKVANPFYTTDLVWDPDINPDGFVEKIDLLKAFNSLTCASEGSVRSESRFGLSLVAGQFVFANNNEDLVGSDYNTDVWLFNTQLIGSMKVTPDVKVTLAPGFMTYTAGNTADLNNSTAFMTTKSGVAVLTQYQYSANSKLLPLHTQGASRDLSVITAPGDVSFKLCGLKSKVFWDFAYNTEGAARVEQIYGLQDIQIPDKNTSGGLIQYKNTKGPVTGNTLVNPTRVSGHSSRDDIAWLLGLQVGENKKKGDWSIMANFRQTGIGAVDPNLNDSDFALGQLNMQGIKAGVAYNFADFCVGAITYYDAWNLRGDLLGGQATAANTNKIANVNAVNILQVDLNVKF